MTSTQLIGTKYLRHVIITWSMRKRGNVQRTHIMTNTRNQPLNRKTTTLMKLPTTMPASRPKKAAEQFRQLKRQPEAPAAQEHDVGDAADREHAAVFGHEDDQPAKAGVFRMKAGDQFAFGLGQIERRPLATGHGAGEIGPKGGEGERIVENIPVPDAALLLQGDGIEVHAAGDDDRHQDAQGHGDFIAHHLGRLAHAAEQRPFASRAIADEDDAEDLRRHDGEHVEDGDVHLAGHDAIAERQRDDRP